MLDTCNQAGINRKTILPILFLCYLTGRLIIPLLRGDLSTSASHKECLVIGNKDLKTLDTNGDHAVKLLRFLSDGESVDNIKNRIPEPNQVVLFISCNWYDRAKAATLLRLMDMFPSSRVVITGGIGRLSSEKAERLGGEALELREYIIELSRKSRKSQDDITKILSRLVIITGLRTTGDNVDFLLHWIDSIIPKKNFVSLIAIEESFLVRRLRATIVGRIDSRKDKVVSDLIPENVIIVPSEANSYDTLKRYHHQQAIYPLYMMSKEFQRLRDYSDPKKSPYLFSSAIAFQILSSNVDSSSASEYNAMLEKQFAEEFKQVDALLTKDRGTILSCLAPLIE